MATTGIEIVISAKDNASPAIGKTRAGLESISRQLQVMRNAWLALQGVTGLSGGVSALANLADQVQQVNARLRLAVQSAREFAQAQALAYDVAARTGAGYEAVATLYVRLAQAASSFGLSQEQVARTTEATALALRVSGASAAESAAVMRQFSQALGSGVLRGDEFNSIMENGGRLAKALADGLGLPVGRLRQLAEQGLLTTDVITRALESQRDTLQREADAMPRTIGQALSQVRDEFGRTVDRLNQAGGVTSKVADAFTALARNMDAVFGAALTAAVGALSIALARAGQAAFGAVAGLVAKLQADRQAALTARIVAQNEVAKAQAMLAAAQAAVTQATGMARLSLVQNQLIPAQQRLAAAQAALNTAMSAGGVAAGVLSRAIGLLGGPLGAILTLLSVGATAWAIWGNKAESAANKAKASAERAQETLERLRKRQRFGEGDAAVLREEIERLEKLQALRSETLARGVSPGARKQFQEDQRRLEEYRQALEELVRTEQRAADGMTDLGRELLGKGFDRFLDQFRQKLDPLGAALAQLREEAQKAGIALDSEQFRRAEELVRKSFARKERPQASALPELRRAAQDDILALREALRAQSDVVETALAGRLVSVESYWRAKESIDAAAFAAERDRLSREIAAQEDLLNRLSAVKPRDDAQREQIARRIADARQQLAELRAELSAIDGREVAAKFRLEVDRERARADIRDAVEEAKLAIAQAQGADTPEMRRAAIERAMRDTINRLAQDAEGQQLVGRLIDIKAAQANLDALETQWRQVTERLRNAQEAIGIQQQAGLLTEAQARERILALQRESAAEMQRLLPAMQQAAQAIGPEAVLRVQALNNELERTRLVTDQMAPLWNGIGESFGAALQAMVTGAQSWRAAMAGLFRQVANAFLQQIVIQPFQQWVAMQARMLAMKLGFVQQEQVVEKAATAQSVAMKSAETTAKVSMDAAQAGSGAAASQAAIPVVGPGLAIAAMAAMVAAVMALLGKVKKFAAGGLVTGPGTATSDSIPARLSAGEYVVRAAAVQRVGVAFLDALNGLRTPPAWDGQRLAFAAGGLVPAVQVAPAAPQVNNAVRIVNAIDPGVTHDHLQTPAGERVILNIIGRNARAVRSALQG